MADEAVELLINLRNHKQEERPLSEEALAFRGESVLISNSMAAQERKREEALGRLRERALEDETLADLLMVLGISLGGVRFCQESSGQSTRRTG
jgi:hypothetical protein